MHELKYIITKIKSKLSKDSNNVISNYFRKSGMNIGNDCLICCNIMCNEPYLINIGNNVTISGEVSFITHDNSVSKFYGRGKDLFGRISVGNNCFIGARVMILYGVSIPHNCIVGAGSIVVNSFTEEGIIIAGNPAKKIGYVSNFYKKNYNNVINTYGLDCKEREKTVLNNSDLFVKR